MSAKRGPRATQHWILDRDRDQQTRGHIVQDTMAWSERNPNLLPGESVSLKAVIDSKDCGKPDALAQGGALEARSGHRTLVHERQPLVDKLGKPERPPLGEPVTRVNDCANRIIDGALNQHFGIGRRIHQDREVAFIALERGDLRLDAAASNLERDLRMVACKRVHGPDNHTGYRALQAGDANRTPPQLLKITHVGS